MHFSPASQPKGSNVMGILSIVAAVPGMCVPGLGLVAVVLGALGLGKAKDPRVGGRGLAMTGLVLGIAGTLFSTLGISILLPSLNRAREMANRIKCQSNLSLIGKSIHLYTNENQGAFPPDLATLARTQEVEAVYFVCPSSDHAAAADHTSIESGGHCSYVYLGKGKTYNTRGWDGIVAFEDGDHHQGEGMHVLWTDGRVEFVDKAEADKIRAKYGR
jgi:hypothetical protein